MAENCGSEKGKLSTGSRVQCSVDRASFSLLWLGRSQKSTFGGSAPRVIWFQHSYKVRFLLLCDHWTAFYFLSGGFKGYGLAVMVEVFCGILSDAAFGPNIRRWSGDERVANLVSALNALSWFAVLAFFLCVFFIMICFVYLGTMLCCFKSQCFCCWIRRPYAVSHEPFAKPPTGKCLLVEC